MVERKPADQLPTREAGKVRVSIVDQDGRALLPKDLPSVAMLQEIVAQAKLLIHECERLEQLKDPRKASRQGKMPYMS